MNTKIQGKKVAILATHGFEESELTSPRDALKEAGATVEIVSPESGELQAFRHLEKGVKVSVDKPLTGAKAEDYDAIVLPGGLFNPDQLRVNADALKFVQAFVKAGKPVAAICHGPWILADAGALKGRKVTSVPTIRKDIENAGASWVDEAVVVDNGIVTSRTPKDLDAFNAKLIEEIAEGRHERRAA
ncbi:type 1 glutamine amidotransferase domain-containing protein [Dokdonella immobilis]|uniref:Protease I n=1 Tax=Dokdonella immobilis TaxID=578942 RepID=A0A1I4Y472_9GAMM|nr:type 1 glutamine amidotransferase domain-containing protein [Dokdonella immobilis]SFN32300.1 protease I [Dokdonella immobilis]